MMLANSLTYPHQGSGHVEFEDHHWMEEESRLVALGDSARMRYGTEDDLLYCTVEYPQAMR